MSKNTRKKTPEPTADTAESPSILTLDTLRAMAQEQRVDLYVTTENRQRLGFLLQGKILHTLGIEGTELLRAAGIKPSSLCNARRAEWVLRAFTDPDTDTLRSVRFHFPEAEEPVPFSEALYNTFTLRQCELLQIGFTTIGTHRHRPTSRQMSEMLLKPDWDDHVECFLECGTDLDGKAEREAEAARALEEERLRRVQLEQDIQNLQARNATLEANALPSLPPIVDTAPAAPENEETRMTNEEAPDNVVAFPATATSEAGTPARSEDTSDEPETSEDTPAEEEASEAVTHEEIAAAVADATAGMEEFHTSGFENLEHLVTEIESDLNAGAAHQCDVEQLNHLLGRLDDITGALRTALTAKAQPQDDLPADQPQPKAKRGKKTTLAAA